MEPKFITNELVDDNEKPKSSIQWISFILLVTGLVASSVVVFVLIFNFYIDWISSLNDFYLSEQRKILEIAVTSRGEAFKYFIEDIYEDLYFLKEVGTDQEISSIRDKIVAVDWETIKDKTSSVDLTSAVYMSDVELNLDDSDIEMFDFLLRVIYTSKLEQVGFYTQIGEIDYRYPLLNMSFLTDVKNCTGQIEDKYFLQESEAYETLYDDSFSYSAIAMNEFGKLNVIVKGVEADFTAFLNGTGIHQIMLEHAGYNFFISEKTGKFTLAIDDEYTECKQLHEVMYTGNEELREPLYNAIKENRNITQGRPWSDELDVSNTELINLAATDINISLWKSEYDFSYSAGVLTDTSKSLSQWIERLDDVIVILILQILMFIVFMALACLGIWIFSTAENNLVSIPLSDVEQYLYGQKRIEELGKNYNKEVNAIIGELQLLDIASKFIEPKFLMNVSCKIQKRNLKEAVKVFESTDNPMSLSYTYNLIGNCYFIEGKFSKSVEAYVLAYGAISNILINETSRETWAIEELIKRTLQLCLAKKARMIEAGIESPNKNQELNEILQYQFEALLLSFYSESMKNTCQILKLMIDISETISEQRDLEFAENLLNQLTIHINSIKELNMTNTQDLLDIKDSIKEFVQLQGLTVSRTILSLHLNMQRGFQEKPEEMSILGVSNFPVSEFPKLHILQQFIFYKLGLLNIKKQKYSDSDEFFHLGISSPDYYDPETRINCANELKATTHEEVPQHIHKLLSVNESTECVMFVFAYDIMSNSSFNEFIVKLLAFVKETMRLGAVSGYSDAELFLEPAHRDSPTTDFANFFDEIKLKSPTKRQSVYDSIIKSVALIKDPNQPKILAFIDSASSFNGVTDHSTLKDVIKQDFSIGIIEVSSIPSNNELFKFVRERQGTYIEATVDKSHFKLAAQFVNKQLRGLN